MPIDEEKLNKSPEESGEKTEFSINEIRPTANKRNKNDYEEVLKISKENNLLLKKILKYHRWDTFFSFLKILIILIPLIAAYIYLVPLLSQVVENYQSALGTVNELRTNTEGLKNINIKDQLKEVKELIK